MDENTGNIKISDEVVSVIAAIATAEVKGVAGMTGSAASGLAEILGGKKNSSKGVKVEIADGNVLIDIHILVEYGVRIPELAWDIQENVKKSVETMTGMHVEKVNIHIEGLALDKKAKQDAPEATEPAPAQEEEEPETEE